MPKLEVKPCPFCGSDKIEMFLVADKVFKINCITCGGNMVICTKYKTQVVASWNTRNPSEKKIPMRFKHKILKDFGKTF